MSSNYLVTPIKGCWKNWQKLAQHVGVEFSEENRLLGEAIFKHELNKYPVARPRVVQVCECFGPSDPSTFDHLFTRGHPVHLVTLLTLMSGIGNEEETKHSSWTYRTVASTLHLTHPSGQVYTFLIDGGNDLEPKWKARFLPQGEWVGRSMYVHQYSYKTWSELYRYFMTGEDGKYGQTVTCF